MLSLRRSVVVPAAFTLVELMLSTAILALLMLILVSITSQTSNTWRYTTGKIEQFREARMAFETMTTRLSQATLNTYWDYDDPTSPTRYIRRSELRFISGQAKALAGDPPTGARVGHAVFFHAPLGLAERPVVANVNNQGYRGLENLLNVWGYYVELNDDRKLRPPFMTQEMQPYRYRFRLMECMQPSDKLLTYNRTAGGSQRSKPDGTVYVQPNSSLYQGREWFTDFINRNDAPVRVLAENVVALIITPRLAKAEEKEFSGAGGLERGYSPLAPNYTYDTTKSVADARLNPRDQLPPVVQVTMVAVDEISASRMNLDQASADILKLSTKFSDTKKYSEDLLLDPAKAADASLENILVSLGANYRVFTSSVPIRAAKWSSEQEN